MKLSQTGSLYRKHAILLIAGLVSLATFAASGVEERKSRHPLSEKALPPPPAVRAEALTGTSGGAVILAGGADAAGLSDEILVLRSGADRWETFKLEQPLAGAAAVTAGNDIVCIGGRTAKGLTDSVFKLTFTAGKIMQTALPDFPFPVARAGAAAIGTKIYVIGGEDSDGVLRRDMLSLDLSDSSGWNILPVFPGPGLRDPVVTAQAGTFLVFGGETIENGESRVWTDSWMYRPKPQDAMRTKGWINIADMPAEWVRPSLFPSGQSHVMILGGSPAGETADNRILIYHVISDIFVDVDQWSGQVRPAAVAGGKSGSVILGITAEGNPAAVQAGFIPVTRNLKWLDYAVIAAYLAALVGIGIYFAKKETSTEEYFLGGRKIPWWAAGISLYAAGTSGFSFMAVPAKSWTTSTLYGMEGLFMLIGTVAAAFLVIPILRKLNITSAYHYLERRFNSALRLWGSGVNIIFQLVGRMSVVLLLPSLAISTVTGIPVLPVIATLGLLATVYTVIGGMGAVIWADILQVAVLFGGAIVSFIIMVFFSSGGVSGWIADNMAYDKFRVIEFSADFTQPVIWIIIMNAVLYVGTACSDQVLVQRVLTTPDVKQARRSYISLALIVLPGSLLFTFLGTAMFSYFRAHPAMLDPAMQDVNVFPLFMVNGLPAGLSGLVIAGLFAASLSTLDASMNSVSTLFVSDFYKRFKHDATDRQCLVLGKFITGFAGISGTAGAMLMATFEIKSMFDVWYQIMALITGGFGGVFILGMFTRRANGWGALIGAVSSIAITASVKLFTPLHFMAFGAVAITSCVVVGYLFSLLIPCKAKDLTGLTFFTPGRDETAKGYYPPGNK